VNEENYRTPDEVRAQHKHDTYVRGVLDQAVRDGASLVVAMLLDEPAEVVERWINALWDGLRDGLADERDRVGHHRLRMEDRLTAIVLLLHDRIQAEATQVLRAVRNVR